ncbi:MAG: hypothetical protein JNM36_13930 [Chitinophagales bacterium]|jgi:acyl carrier protein|nr:hypothetical protein [Chitinophagales bacterium]
MERSAIHATVIDILKKYTRKPEVWDTATDDSKILQDLKINSARLVDITLELEDTFDIEVDNDSMDRIVTIKDTVDIVAEKLA